MAIRKPRSTPQETSRTGRIRTAGSARSSSATGRQEVSGFGAELRWVGYGLFSLWILLLLVS
jgi:hypothetical protein